MAQKKSTTARGAARKPAETKKTSTARRGTASKASTANKAAAASKPSTATRTAPARKASPARKPTTSRRPRKAAPSELEPQALTSSELAREEQGSLFESRQGAELELAQPLPPAEIPQDSAPEAQFAARVPPPAPERPRPEHRRAVFFDVENTSRASDVAKILEHVAIDRSAMTTELVASGNWRVIGNETARLLARAGAHLVHSAPATGVRDWSDLRIAVAAGVWLASARPGDQLDIVSDDKAFDVVGDVAATLGVLFRKLSYRALLRGGTTEREAPARGRREKASGEGEGRTRRAAGEGSSRGGRRRGGRGGRSGSRAAVSETTEAAAPIEAQAPAEAFVEAPVAEARPKESTPLAAPDAQLQEIVDELLQQQPAGVMLDTVANRLKALGFERPPGSPRLVTRVRALSGIDVSPRGLVRRKGEGAADEEVAEAPVVEGEESEAPARKGRRRRRGGRRHGGKGNGSAAAPTTEG
jgi:hypothetical protein